MEMTSASIAQDPDIVVVNLPARSNFEEIDAVNSPGLFETPAGASLRMNIELSGSGSNCDALSGLTSYLKVLGEYIIGLTLFPSIYNEWF